MTQPLKHVALMMLIPALTALCLAPLDVSAWVAPPWIDKIALVVMEQKKPV